MGNIASLDVRGTRSASGSHDVDTESSAGGQKGVPTDPLGTTGQAHGPGLTISGGTFNNVTGNQINQTYYAQPVDYDETLRKEMLEWLSTINFRTIFQENIARRTSGIGMGFINSQQFERWLLRKYGILWGTGIRTF
ncbi:hypothetical protein BKA70DRAFT_671666 [Coprinopsis sp. MPI-PUGE-AT-0042]|nr:hypothetical protein BKA70DRAFT_671666 [Coprinopsis sp. MPI-PUGE-AT-0042]